MPQAKWVPSNQTTGSDSQSSPSPELWRANGSPRDDPRSAAQVEEDLQMSKRSLLEKLTVDRGIID